MPSGAKKRKAAKKKMQKAHKNGAHPPGSDDARSLDERDSDGGEVEREHSEEGSVENHDEGTKDVSLGDENAAQTGERVEGEDKSNDVSVEAEGETQNGDASVEHKSSSSSSSSDEEEVAVEKEEEKPVVLESSAEVEHHEEDSSPPEDVVSEEKTEPIGNEVQAVSTENSEEKTEPVANESEPVSTENSEGVRDLTEESVPVEESVKEVVSSPPETESVPAVNMTVSETIVVEFNQYVEELPRSSVYKDQISSTVTGFLQNIQTNATQVVERGLENLPVPFNGAAKENEALLPQSSGVTIAERNGGSDHVKESEKQPLVSSAPLPVQRTSWMNCCGLLEVFSGGASR